MIRSAIGGGIMISAATHSSNLLPSFNFFPTSNASYFICGETISACFLTRNRPDFICFFTTPIANSSMAGFCSHVVASPPIRWMDGWIDRLIERKMSLDAWTTGHISPTRTARGTGLCVVPGTRRDVFGRPGAHCKVFSHSFG